jgi:hypothetical protein
MSPNVILRQLFGDNRAEWPSTNFRELFVEPTYLKKVETMRPCFLVGGRGTGKTTSLQSLRYDLTLERLRERGMVFDDQEYLGVLVRMNKNRVRAFQGESANQDRWAKLFAHYFNLLVAQELVSLASWLEGKAEGTLTQTSMQHIAADLALPKSDSLPELSAHIRKSISVLQLQVNNPTHELGLTLSMAESPLRVFVDALMSDGLIGTRVVFCCIDEYENLLDYQQAILNTYVKHAEPPLSYKIGVRKNGLRNRQTLDGQDLLKTPDDYAEVEIAEEGFDYFAKAVAEQRLRYARRWNANIPDSLGTFLGELTLRREAALLGATQVGADVISELKSDAPEEILRFFQSKPLEEIYFIRFWQDTEPTSLVDLARDWMLNEQKWDTRFGNYAFSSLFWLSKGAKGARIRKYYCGERVLLSLAAGNIRYFLELIDAAISYQLDEDNQSLGPLVISPKSQTLAARDVGKRRLTQLDGLADNGPQLKRLVLAVGKVFFELSRSPNGHSPEVTSFVLSGPPEDVKAAEALLADGVAHLAFEASPRTKATSNLELRDDEYRLHRIFCAFFEISHRRKRRLTFNAKDLLAVLDNKPSRAIGAMLGGQEQSNAQSLPEQLAFFAPFYEGGQQS